MTVREEQVSGDKVILCFGDSNTHGTVAMDSVMDRRRFSKNQRWPNVMATELDSGWEVIAEGHPGRTAVFDDPVEGAHKNGLTVLPSLLETHRPIDLVIVLLGTNDTKARFSANAFDIAKALERVVRAINSSDAGPDCRAPRVLLAAPVPVVETGPIAPMFEGAAAKARALGPLLAQAAARCGAGFIDLASVAEVDPTDGVHLSAGSQAAIGRAMAETVRAMFS
ncbi:SGNH/GDSL hydrolase family protein [Pseudoruegeria sp. HB172150]|uniref:SGNH/GDSL hydrolase family protein n=1 Tax=Pseudoruegeria sp. HB172150 TaxID=2721164 RepID=UPI0015546258|nr:SGNH/GDSL hydrolase family protein [Pseudoruegeria sp. HB172150]